MKVRPECGRVNSRMRQIWGEERCTWNARTPGQTYGVGRVTHRVGAYSHSADDVWAAVGGTSGGSDRRQVTGEGSI